MAALVEGQVYGLSSQDTTSAGKSVIHVKLTDSALKAIDEYYSIKNGIQGRNPTVQFRGNDGEILIPAGKSSDNREGYSKFSFSLSTIQGDPKGSFDCIQQVRGSHDELSMLGSMTQKIVVHAKDDSYQNTKERMTLAEEVSKKQRAKEIKPSGKYIGRKIKKVVKGGKIDLPSKPSSSSLHQSAFVPTNNKPSITSLKPVTATSPANSIRDKVVTSHQCPKQPIPAVGKMQTLTSGKTSPKQLNSSVPKQQPLTLGKMSPNSAVANLPYRDRIIHLLAIKPYKKLELLPRLRKDGIREKDKNLLGVTLKQVAVQKDNTFSLAKHLYSEVRPDWPGYTDVDRQLLKRNMAAANAGSTHSNSSSPAVSPCHSQGSQGSPNSSNKRPTSTTDDYELPVAKKARTAHVAHQSRGISPTKQEATTTTPDLHSSGKRTPDNVKVQNKDKKGYKSQNNSPNDAQADRENRNENSEPDSLKLPATSTSETPDYLLNYKTIVSPDQRCTYKQDFNNEYEEYRSLHSNVEKVTKNFKYLQEQLEKWTEGSDDYENIKNKIVHEYRTVKKDPKYIEQRKRCDYLHKKLAHIKKLIMEYDRVEG